MDKGWEAMKQNIIEIILLVITIYSTYISTYYLISRYEDVPIILLKQDITTDFLTKTLSIILTCYIKCC